MIAPGMHRFPSTLMLLAALPLAAADADRDVALWALRMGGAVVLEGSDKPIRDVIELPDGDFRIVVLNMIGTNMHPPHMEAFGKLTALRELHVPGPMWNPRAESRTEYSEETRHLAGLRRSKNWHSATHFSRRSDSSMWVWTRSRAWVQRSKNWCSGGRG